MISVIPYIENSLKIFINRRHLRKISELKLTNELNYNLRVIDMINWSGINLQTKKHLVNQLSTNSLEEYIYLGKPNLIEKLLLKKAKVDMERTEDEKLVDKESLIGSTINRIKTIKVIANFPEELLENDKSRFSTRINNICLGLNDLKKLIEYK